MIFRSPHPHISIPDVSFHEYVLAGTVSCEDKPAFVQGETGRTITHGELAAAVRATAAGLAQRGFRKGEVLAIQAPNLPEYPVVFLGATATGGTVTTLNPLHMAEETAKQLADSGARYLVTVPALAEQAREAAAAGRVEEIFLLPGENGGAGTGGYAGASHSRGSEESVAEKSMAEESAAEGSVQPGGGQADAPGPRGDGVPMSPFHDLLATDAPLPRPDLDPVSEVAALPYSSGTTGLPKGVMLTHRNLVANLCQLVAVEPIGKDEVALGVLPFFHIYGMIVVMASVIREGATAVIMSRFDLEEMLLLMQNYGVTRANLVPPIILALAKDPSVREYDLERLRLVGSGAAPLGAEVARACEERIGCQVREGYGLTETSPVTHWNPPERNKHGSVGPPLPNTEVMIAGLESGERLGPGEEGEVCIRGPQVMKGYLDQPEATASILDQGGWLHTGDVGRVDADGYLYVVDRVKELINYKGYQVPPAELEAVLVSHPAVADAAVIPSPHQEAGEVPKAFVVPAGEGTGDLEEQLVDFVAGRVAPYKKVRRLEAVDEIPRSAAGKILRRVLVERERERVGPPQG